MDSNKLKLNDNKTEVMLISRNNASKTTVDVNGIPIDSKVNIKNLGVMFDNDMSMSSQVGALCKSMNFQLRKISTIRNYITEDVAKTLITSLILTKLDYCNSLLAGLPNEFIKRLQSVQNNAARLIFKKKKRDHITPLLKELHWLPVKERIDYKICLLCYKSLNNMAPAYLSNILNRYKPTRALRSLDDSTILVIPRYKYVRSGQRSFSFYGPNVWNKLPKNIREANSSSLFKNN